LQFLGPLFVPSTTPNSSPRTETSTGSRQTPATPSTRTCSVCKSPEHDKRTCARKPIPISDEPLRRLEAYVARCNAPTGDPIQDEINQAFLGVLASPNGCDIQEKLIAEACGAAHKGNKKLGADATLSGDELEIKPCKGPKDITSVNITDDTPSRLLKDMRQPNKRTVIGRARGGMRFDWLVVCPTSDFAESRYKKFCSRWKYAERPWPATLEEQIRLVESLPERPSGEYVRSAQLKLTDIKTILGSWIHPDIDVEALTGRTAELRMQQRIADM
jgi:hypothetical protein